MIHWLFWLFCYLASRTLVTFRVEGDQKTDDISLVIANHVSSIDWVFIKSIYNRPTYFVADHKLWNNPIYKFFLNLVGCIPIGGSVTTTRKALKTISLHIKQGDLVVFFPEGKLTLSGKVEDFKPGLKRIITDNPVIKIQVLYLEGLYDSFWSKKNRNLFTRIFKSKRPTVTLHLKAVFNSVLFNKVFKDKGLSYLQKYLLNTERRIIRQ